MNSYPKTRKERAGTLTAAILLIARQPGGYVFTDPLDGYPNVEKRKLWRAIENLTTVKKIHRLQIAGTSSFRYFGHLADRERLAMEQPERQPKADRRAGKIPTFTNVAKVPTGGPARLPGEPVITTATKFTYGHSPTNPIRTTTHSEAA